MGLDNLTCTTTTEQNISVNVKSEAFTCAQSECQVNNPSQGPLENPKIIHRKIQEMTGKIYAVQAKRSLNISTMVLMHPRVSYSSSQLSSVKTDIYLEKAIGII